MPSYVNEPELEAVGLELVKKHHPDLVSINVGYLFRDTAPLSRGRIVLGMCVKVDDRNHVFSGKDVIIEVGRDVWDAMDPELREILVDHELCHIGVELDDKGNPVLANNGRPKVFIKPHDVEEFQDILDRYGSVHKRFHAVVESLEHVASSGKSGSSGQ